MLQSLFYAVAIASLVVLTLIWLADSATICQKVNIYVVNDFETMELLLIVLTFSQLL